ncbi:MAG: HEAT repeat domain-containing protein [Planctomycetes bacterium]|nr:HEAT repeat domain-containing protein [Planctomycetota bacterium]
MLPLLLVVCLSPFPSAVRSHDPVAVHGPAVRGEDKAIKALDAWLKLWRSGKIAFASKDNIAKDSLAMKYEVVPRSAFTDPTWAKDLELILEAVARIDDADAARALLEVAAIGIDQGKYTPDMAPASVRDAGERWAAKLRTPAAKEELCRVARGEAKVPKAQATAWRAAAARCLGLIGDPTLLSAIEPLLADPEDVVRFNAAEAFGKLADENKAEPLVALVRREATDTVLMTAAQALREAFTALTKVDKAASDATKAPESLRLAVRAVIEALGRTTWRADMALVRFLDDFRSQEAVPALVSVLERFRDQPDDVKSGKLSGLLQFQVHELLVSMTGAVFPATEPDKWRQFWDTEKDKIEVTAKHEPKGGGATSAGDFCGIPIEGTRVVFVLDLSGSMNWPMRSEAGTGRKKTPTGLDFLKQELRRAIGALAPNAQCNLVTFNGNPKPELWQKDLVPATDKNRERLLKYVDELRADGGTNLWCGLEEAMKIKSLVHNTRYECNVDELFVLSDGAPSVGAVTEPVQILRLVAESNRAAGMRINTVFVNTVMPEEYRRQVPEPEMKPAELMQRLAEQNGGVFREL